jgi:arylsulfatase A-like enzyme
MRPVLFLLLLVAGRMTWSDERPNVIVIVADDLGWKDAGYLGSRFYETPNLDRLAGQSTVFRRAYACPSCAPTRAALMSGQYSPRHGVFMVSASDRGDKTRRKLVPIPNREDLPVECVTIAEALAKEGYATGLVGKWHLGGGPAAPEHQGFQLRIGRLEHGADYTYFSPYGGRITGLSDTPPGEYLADRLTAEALRFMDDHKDKPFFLCLTHYVPHVPIEAKPEDEARFLAKAPDGAHTNATYAGMIWSLDRSVGQVLEKIDRLGLAGRTYVVFLSDNGGQMGITAQPPLREGKGWLYEGGVRVPMLIRAPGLSGGANCDQPVHVVDLYPTILRWTGAKAPAGHALDGVSLEPLLADAEASLDRDALFWHFPGYQPMGRPPFFRIRPSSMIVSGAWKLIENFEDGTTELYNLYDDMGETRNLSNAEPEKARELRERLAAWRASVNAPVPMQENPEYQPR